MKPRRITIITAAAAAATVLASGVALATETGAVAGTAAQATSVTITMGAHNSHYGDGAFKRFAGVIGWQEVNDPVDRRKLNRRLGSEYRTFYPDRAPAKAVPISWRAKRFEKLSSGSRRTHGGEAKVTPSRFVNWVVLKVRGSDKRFAFVNTHFISGAWSKHPNRQARWLKHYRVLKDVVGDIRKKHPKLPIFVAGDFNRHKAMDMPAGVGYVRVKGGGQVPLDHMYASKQGSHTRVSRLSRWGSDHHAYRMGATF